MKKQVFLILFMAIFSMAGFSQTVVTQSTGLMAEPSLTSKRVTTVYEGDIVALDEKSGEFWKVTVGRKTGYIHETCLSNYVDPNKKELEKAVTENEVKEKAVVVPVAQDSATIVYGPRNRLYYEGRLLTIPQLEALLITNPAAKAEWKKRNTQYILAMIIAGSGGGVLGNSLVRGSVAGVLIGLGIGGIGVGIGAFSDKTQRNAINIYNQGITGKPGSVSLRLGVAQYGYGLTLSF